MTDHEGSQFQSSQRQVQTAIPSDVEMSIRRIDWRRVYRKVKSIPRETSLYETVENVSWGVAAAALLALIPLYQGTQGTEFWVKPAFIVVAVLAVCIGGLSRHFAASRREIIHSSCDEVLQDMSEVYETFFPESNLDGTGG